MASSYAIALGTKYGKFFITIPEAGYVPYCDECLLALINTSVSYNELRMSERSCIILNRVDLPVCFFLFLFEKGIKYVCPIIVTLKTHLAENLKEWKGEVWEMSGTGTDTRRTRWRRGIGTLSSLCWPRRAKVIQMLMCANLHLYTESALTRYPSPSFSF